MRNIYLPVPGRKLLCIYNCKFLIMGWKRSFKNIILSTREATPMIMKVVEWQIKPSGTKRDFEGLKVENENYIYIYTLYQKTHRNTHLLYTKPNVNLFGLGEGRIKLRGSIYPGSRGWISTQPCRDWSWLVLKSIQMLLHRTHVCTNIDVYKKYILD